MEALDIEVVFYITLFGYKLPITETVVVSWAVMAILIIVSIILTRNLKQIPQGGQAILEEAVEFLNKFSKDQFGKYADLFSPYVGTLFLFLLVANIIGIFSPVEVSVFGLHYTPPFSIKPPTRDINVTAPLACITLLLVLICGFRAKGFGGWCKNLLHPIPMMLPFNIMEYGTRLVSLTLRLFGNILGAFILMRMIEGLFPLALPMIFSLYFDFFDGFVQAMVFTFLTCLYISEALKTGHEE